jgi:hypothetical protein
MVLLIHVEAAARLVSVTTMGQVMGTGVPGVADGERGGWVHTGTGDGVADTVAVALGNVGVAVAGIGVNVGGTEVVRAGAGVDVGVTGIAVAVGSARVAVGSVCTVAVDCTATVGLGAALQAGTTSMMVRMTMTAPLRSQR